MIEAEVKFFKDMCEERENAFNVGERNDDISLASLGSVEKSSVFMFYYSHRML